eukprot:c28545_g3_i1 orf=219-368(+)
MAEKFHLSPSLNINFPSLEVLFIFYIIVKCILFINLERNYHISTFSVTI